MLLKKMVRSRNVPAQSLMLLGLMIALAPCASATIASFSNWTLVEDPADANFTAVVDSSSQVTLTGVGPIGLSTDIGYQSINGNDAATSSAGYVFDPTASFSVAVDFDLTFTAPSGGFSIGFGIGEDGDGVDSAGIVLAREGTFGVLGYGGAARINDVTQSPLFIGFGASSGRFIVSYDAASGDILLGVSTDGNDSPELSGTFSGIQNSWDDEPLMVSLFARGGDGTNSWASGTATVVFSDMHVISGSALAIPEPSSALLILVGVAGVAMRRSR